MLKKNAQMIILKMDNKLIIIVIKDDAASANPEL